MADLTELESAGTMKVVGSNATGLETNPLAVDSNGNLKVGITSDGTNVVTITAPSTAPLATDRAIVVAISPNTSIATSNNQGIPNTLANAWPVKVTEGTNILGTSANPFRVDPTGTTAQPVTDNGGSITVDGTVAASQSGTWNITNISGAISLPTDASTSALQTTGNSSLSSIDTKTPALGQATMANSSPVVLASNQSAIPVTQSGAWAVTANAGTNLNTSALNLEATQAAMSAKLPATLGQKAMTASMAVVLASDQSAIQVTQALPPNSTPNLAFGDILLAAITTAAIRRTAYTAQSANFTGSIVSSSVNDSAAGTGARTVRIYYVDSTGATAGTEDVTLNGTTAVNLVTTTKCFVEKMEVLTVGSGGSNAGIITLKTGAAGAGTTVGTISVGDNRTFWAHHYVVTGQTSNITGILVGSNVTNTSGSCVGFIRSTPLNAANQVEKQVSDFVIVAGLDSAVYRSFVSQIKVVGPARVTMYVTTGTGSSFTYRGSFDAYDL